jgi:hypothetical protein
MPLPSFWSLSKPESPACPSSSGSDARSTLGPARAPSSSSASRSSPSATSRGTVSSRLLFLLGLLGALLALPLHARAQEFSSLPHLASYGIVPAAGTGSSGSGRVLSLAADASAALPPLAVLSLSFALCAPSAEGVEIFVSTSADYPAPSSADLEPADDDADGRSRWMSDSDKGVWFIDLTEGYGTWQGALRDGVRDGLWVALWGGDQGASGDVEISFSTGGESRACPRPASASCRVDAYEAALVPAAPQASSSPSRTSSLCWEIRPLPTCWSERRRSPICRPPFRFGRRTPPTPSLRRRTTRPAQLAPTRPSTPFPQARSMKTSLGVCGARHAGSDGPPLPCRPRPSSRTGGSSSRPRAEAGARLSS